MPEPISSNPPPAKHIQSEQSAQVQEAQKGNKKNPPSLMTLVILTFMETMGTVAHSMVAQSKEISYSQRQAQAALNANSHNVLIQVQYLNKSGKAESLGTTTYESNINKSIQQSRSEANLNIQAMNTGTSEQMQKSSAQTNALSQLYQMTLGTLSTFKKVTYAANITRAPQ